MRILAWMVLVLAVLTHAITLQWALERKTRVYEPSDGAWSFVSLVLLGALCGRVLGWW